ncbi:MAG: YIP1 family protein [Deltaproteobacteria bacterium]|jgi:hypothetical protein|nr:YIP1 family protein [Deltaproteobacteria bacterium]MBK8238234.1 YIP1 family protein [Deltaproteobacteria bacterium]MBP7290589.1 YIP1 family protein [Nannocystaceae bacterium]
MNGGTRDDDDAIPVEASLYRGRDDGPQRGWIAACTATLIRAFTRPTASFRRCPEPVAHGRVLGYLATLRLPAWALLLAIEASRLAGDRTPALPLRSIHNFIEPPLAQALSAWLVLMVPVGLPLLYFFGGLLAHVGIALTGGASRSIGASMRAVGYASGPALLVIALLDLPLYLMDVPAMAYLCAVAISIVLLLFGCGMALARTHQFSQLRGLLVSLLPAALLLGVTVARAALVLRVIPGLPVPEQAYYVP